MPISRLLLIPLLAGHLAGMDSLPPVISTEVVPPVVAQVLRVVPPTPAEFVSRISKTHPRLLLTNDDQARLVARLATDPIAQRWLGAIRANGAYYEGQPPIAYVPEPIPGQRAQVGPMLWPGRAFVDRVLTLGLLARLEPAGPAFERLRQEVQHALTWADWGNDIARYEIACGMAIAYDWCHERWTPAERAALEQAMAQRALEGYQTDFQRWTGKVRLASSLNRNNVNLVNNAGASLAAMALADVRPDLAGPVLTRSFALIQVSLAAYGDDGTWYEGINYWRFASRHLAQYAACLISATGSDQGLFQEDRYPGVAHTAAWALQMTAPSGRPFDFADGDARPFASAALLWLGWRYGIPLAVEHERRIPFQSATDPLHRNLGREVVHRLLFDRDHLPPATAAPALDADFLDGGIGVMRSSWSDPAAVFVGIKAGTADGNRHAHLDAGTIIMEADGRRWLTEIGPGPYEKPYFGEDRYRYFQARTEGHGTLILDPAGPAGGNHQETGVARVKIVRSEAGMAEAQVDLRGVYPTAQRVERRVVLDRASRQVRIDDTVELPVATTIRWQAYTPAPGVTVSEDGRSVLLSYPADATSPAAYLRLRLKSDDLGQRFVEEDAAPLDPAVVRNPGTVPGFRRLAIVVSGSREAAFAVTLEPGQ